MARTLAVDEIDKGALTKLTLDDSPIITMMYAKNFHKYFAIPKSNVRALGQDIAHAENVLSYLLTPPPDIIILDQLLDTQSHTVCATTAQILHFNFVRPALMALYASVRPTRLICPATTK